MVGVATAATATATAKAFNRLAPAARLIDALRDRAGRFISFASPKETNQRKGAPRLRPSGVPYVGREPRVSLHSSAPRNGRNPRWVRREVGKNKRRLVLLGQQRMLIHPQALAHVTSRLQGEGPGEWMVCPGPLSSAEQRTSGAGQRQSLAACRLATRCPGLTGWRRGLSERACARVSQPPTRLSGARESRQRRDAYAGRPFLWFVSFGRAKEMNPPARRQRASITAPQALGG